MKEISIFWSFVPSSVFLARQEQIWISFFKAMAEISSTEFEEIETSVFEITMASPYDHAYPFRLMVEEVPELLNRFLPREAGRSWLLVDDDGQFAGAQQCVLLLEQSGDLFELAIRLGALLNGVGKRRLPALRRGDGRLMEA